MLSDKRELDEYLARIRKTIADSKNMVSQVELRIAETDRLLEQQGLTREQVMAMRFSEAQKEAVNAELERRGLDPLEKWENDARRETMGDVENARRETVDESYASPIAPPVSDAELENRQRKFGMMMKPFQI